MKKKRFILGAILVGVLGLNLYSAYGDSERVYTNNLEYADSPIDNPLMGFASWESIDSNFPHSLEYYTIALNEVQTGYDTFDWSVLEDCLNKSKNNGNQAIIRFIVDCPGKDTGIPKFLIDNNLKTNPYDLGGEKGLCPDYSDVNLQTALVNFIKAFGEKYDGDPRIGFIQAGLLGFWGEWHTYPYTQWYPSEDVYRLIGKTYTDSFKKTHIMVGEPQKGTAEQNIGYHDDMFAIDTYDYLDKLKEFNLENKWMEVPIGSELAPYIQEKYFTDTIEEALDWNETVQLIHPTWCLNAAIENYSESDKTAAMKCAEKIGYKFNIKKAEATIKDNTMKLNVHLDNMGNAPFYYDWNIQVRVKDVNNDTVHDFDTGWKLTDIKQLNTTYRFNTEMTDAIISKNKRYKVYMKVINPMDGGKNLRFANSNQQSDGWIELLDFTA